MFSSNCLRTISFNSTAILFLFNRLRINAEGCRIGPTASDENIFRQKIYTFTDNTFTDNENSQDLIQKQDIKIFYTRLKSLKLSRIAKTRGLFID